MNINFENNVNANMYTSNISWLYIISDFILINIIIYYSNNNQIISTIIDYNYTFG